MSKINMFKEFRKYAGIKLLEFFIFNPKTEVHIKELSRKLKISPSTTKYWCDLFLKHGILIVNKKGTLRIFSLNNSSVYTKEIKRVHMLLYFKELGIEKISKKDTSLAIYGSYASGEFDENSDIDILIIGKDNEVNKDFVLKFEKKIKKQVQLTIIPYYKWEEMKRKKDPFVMEVLSNHILIKGVSL